jgi:energy-coupling factor transporter ATP-binding protein EcfA2
VVGVTLALRKVGYRYAGATRASLLDVDLDLADGTVIGLAGASESGKTTLCLVASGLAPRTVGGQIRGSITLDGEVIDAWPMHRLSQRIGIGFQNPATQLSQVAGTVFEEVAFGPMNLAAPRDEVIERTWAALDALRVGDLAERDPGRLSGGQQQLVAMAGLLAMRPEHLILDEPTAQLDPAGTRLVAEAIANLAADGRSILVAEQKTDLLADVASSVIVLDAGRVALRGPAGDVLADPTLADLGVPEPSAVRLRRAAAAAGVGGERLEAALRG